MRNDRLTHQVSLERPLWPTLQWLAVVGLGVILGACSASKGSSSGSTSTGGSQCVPGVSVSCACPSGQQGAQVCTDDGESFGACTCQSGSSSTTSGSTGSSAGASSSSGASSSTGVTASSSSASSSSGSGSSSGSSGITGSNSSSSGNTGSSGSTGSSRCTPIFGAPMNHVTSPWAHQPQVADFNGDGLADLAFVSTAYNTDTVTVLLGTADGGFARPAFYSTSMQPTNLAAVDLNGDGLPDLAFTCGAPSTAGNGVGVLFAFGDGGFSSEAFTYATNSSFTPQGVGFADFNHDGFMDLAFGNFVGGISVFYGLGDGGLRFTLLSGGSNNQGLSVADFNEDGLPDVLTMGASSSTAAQLVEYLGLPDGGFGAPVLVPAYHQFGAAGFTADVNGDGHLDVLVPDFQGGVSEFLGYGDGTFATETALPRIPLGAFGDFDRDGLLDVAGDALTGGIQVTFGDGDGGFDATPAGPYALTYGAGDMVVFDFNHDGKPDLAVANGDTTSGYSQVSIFLNQCP